MHITTTPTNTGIGADALDFTGTTSTKQVDFFREFIGTRPELADLDSGGFHRRFGTTLAWKVVRSIQEADRRTWMTSPEANLPITEAQANGLTWRATNHPATGAVEARFPGMSNKLLALVVGFDTTASAASTAIAAWDRAANIADPNWRKRSASSETTNDRPTQTPIDLEASEMG